MTTDTMDSMDTMASNTTDLDTDKALRGLMDDLSATVGEAVVHAAKTCRALAYQIDTESADDTTAAIAYTLAESLDAIAAKADAITARGLDLARAN